MEEKNSFFKTIVLFWKNIFNYRDLAERREYFLSFLFQAAVFVVDFALGYLSYATKSLCIAILFCLLAVYLLVSILPWISLNVRRLHKIGKSGWWTLLMAIVGLGLIILLAMCTASGNAGIGFGPFFNYNANVYGPPEYFEPENNANAPVYGPPGWLGDNFDPAENENIEVYGPPEYWDVSVDEEAEEVEKATEEDNPDFIPDSNFNVAVYGPPEWFEDKND